MVGTKDVRKKLWKKNLKLKNLYKVNPLFLY